MNRTASFKELQKLLFDAVNVLGEHRVALGIGCDVATIRTWQRLVHVHVRSQTLSMTLPRLRGWRSWVAGHHVAAEELEQLIKNQRTWVDEVAELRLLVNQGFDRFNLKQLAQGCAVSPHRLVTWYFGSPEESERVQVLSAVAQLRHLADWPRADEASLMQA
jgi:hypothetical protein